MSETIAQALFSLFKNQYLTTFFISIIPMIEVRGAIPIGVTLGMNIWVSYVFAVLSALVICPILILFLKPVLNWLKSTKIFKKIGTAFTELFTEKAQKIDDKADLIEDDDAKKKALKVRLKKWIGVFIFVAIPLPMTGVWTGTAVGVFLNQKWYDTLTAVVAGNFVAGAIITALTILLKDLTWGGFAALDLILYALFAFMLITLAGLFLGLYKKSKKAKGKAQETVENTEEKEAQ